MSSALSWRGLSIVAGAAALLAAPGSAFAGGAAPGCLNDELPDHVLYVGGTPEAGFHLGVQGTTIVVTHVLSDGGGDTLSCNGATPTTSNLDSIQVLVEGDGIKELQIANPPAFGPGFTSEMIPPSEIEITANLGAGPNDPLTMIVGESNLRLGQTGVDWNPGSPFVEDADIASVQGVDIYRVVAGADNSTASGLGTTDTGGPTNIQINYEGGSGRDVVFGGIGPDYLNGGSNRDVLRGGKGNDTLRAGPGRNDRLFGEQDLDALFAKDGRRDKTLDCGPGANDVESAKRDKGKDPQPKSC